MLMMAAVTKEVTFDCAHMLSGHRGKCANLHGHTYKCQITVQGFIKTSDEEASDASMVLDFGDLQSAIRQDVTGPLDHALIFSAEEFRGGAEEELYDWATCYHMKHFVLEGRSTSEVMANYIRQKTMQMLTEDLRADFKDVHVRLWETPTSFAEV
jgi:6-pyruvoyltetrahydropterin/6-carboxytetrahydropterin synthase